MPYMSKISFCITCKNRLHQISETLPDNLSDNFLFKKLIEFIVINLGSNYEYTNCVINSFTNELNSGYLSSNELLVNLDCDNYTGRFGKKFVIKNFIKYNSNIVYHQFSMCYGDETYGRIGLTIAFLSG